MGPPGRKQVLGDIVEAELPEFGLTLEMKEQKTSWLSN